MIKTDRKVDFYNIEDIKEYFLEIAFILYSEMNPIVVESYIEKFENREIPEEELKQIKMNFNNDLDTLNMLFEHISIYIFNLVNSSQKKQFINLFKAHYELFKKKYEGFYIEEIDSFKNFKKERFKMFKLNIKKEKV